MRISQYVTSNKGKGEQPGAAAAAASDTTGFNPQSLLTCTKWRNQLCGEFEKAYFKKITELLTKEYKAGKQIFPPKQEIFNAFNLTPLDSIKVVIIGQDPYHDDRQVYMDRHSTQ